MKRVALRAAGRAGGGAAGRLALGPQWAALVPALAWLLAAFIIPISAPGLDVVTTWATAVAASLAVLGSLAAHALGHRLAARLAGAPSPERIPLDIYGDPSQCWPPAPTPLRDSLVAAAGPAASALLATAAALVWNAQLHPALNALAFLATVFNGALALVNMAPGAPLDGGRIVRSMVAGDLRLPRRALAAARVSGALIGAALVAWGAFLVSLGARFSLETGAATAGAGLALLAGLRHRPAAWPDEAPGPPGRLRLIAGVPGVALVGAVLLAAAAGLVPLVDGMYAPGPAVSVEPMVRVPQDRRSGSAGQLLLTTVIAQTPITLGQWAYTRFDPAFTLVPPERVVPRDTTPQQLMLQNVRMLEESEATAIVVGAQMAGLQAGLTSTALQVTGVAPESLAGGQVHVRDIIRSVDGAPTPRLDLLRAELARRRPGDTVTLALERDGQPLSVSVPLMGPAEPGGAPRIGVTLQPLGLDVDLPFPITIATQKIAGGPSAGLMFTLAVYDLLTPEDLTRGWRVAGTGTIALDGTVGPIGGVAQKVAGAEWAGADYFIVPREHEAEARRVARRIRIIPVSTAAEAVAALRALPAKAP